jgi:RNA-directed DNA polymerase
MFRRECRYANFSHPLKSRYWTKEKYWGRLNLDRKDKWVFGDKHTGAYLPKFSWFNIERHILVKGANSPDDPRLRKYWENRSRTKVKDLTPSRQRIARNQQCICPECGGSLFNGEELHVHHVKPKSQGGKDTYSNLKLVHLLCHQQIHKA